MGVGIFQLGVSPLTAKRESVCSRHAGDSEQCRVWHDLLLRARLRPVSRLVARREFFKMLDQQWRGRATRGRGKGLHLQVVHCNAAAPSAADAYRASLDAQVAGVVGVYLEICWLFPSPVPGPDLCFDRG